MANLTMMWMMIVLVVINHSSALLVPQHFVVNTSMSLIAAGRPSLDCDHGSLLCRLTGEDDLDLLVMPFANLQECRCTFPASLATASPGYYTVSLVTMNQEGAVNATLEASRVLVTSSPLQWSALASSSGGDGSPQPSATPAFYQGYGGKLRLVHLGDPFPKHACPVAPIAAKLQFLKGGALFWTANLSCSVELGDGRTQTIFSTEHLDYIPVGDALCPSNGSSCLVETMVSLGEGRWSPVGPLSVVPPMSIYRSRPRSITVPSDGDRFVVCVDARTSSGEAAAVPQLLLSTDGNFTIDAFINRSCFQGYFSLRPSNNTTTVLVGNGDAASLDEPSAMPNTHYGVSHHVSRFFSMLATPTTSSFVRMNGVDWIRISDDGSASTVYSGPLTDGTNPDCPDCKSNVVLIVAVVVPSVVVLVVVVCALWRCCRRETVQLLSNDRRIDAPTKHEPYDDSASPGGRETTPVQTPTEVEDQPQIVRRLPSIQYQPDTSLAFRRSAALVSEETREPSDVRWLMRCASSTNQRALLGGREAPPVQTYTVVQDQPQIVQQSVLSSIEFTRAPRTMSTERPKPAHRRSSPQAQHERSVAEVPDGFLSSRSHESVVVEPVSAEAFNE